VETFRAVARNAPGAAGGLPQVLDLISLVGLDKAVRAAAQTVTPPAVRTLDALHLATALRMRDQLISFVTYDLRLAEAASATGLPADAPTR